MESKVGIVTFHNGSNFGAALQAYALQEAVKKFGLEVKIVNYDNHFISDGLKFFKLKFSLLGAYLFLMDIFFYRSKKTKVKRFHDFFKLYETTELLSARDLKIKDLEFDTLISGSDQIWNPLLNRGFDRVYFGEFGNVKRFISYGSSVGNYNFDIPKYNNFLKEQLSKYDAISVREQASKLSEITGKKVSEVCDPTLLISGWEWRNRFQLNKKNDKYVLVYSLSDSKRVTDIAIKIANQRGMKVYFIGAPLKNASPGVNYLLDLGPIEFLEFFYNASYVVTNSFHGTAFAVNFGKQFLSIRHKKSPERAKTLLEHLNLTKRLVDDYREDMPDISKSEYLLAQDRLLELRKEGYKFIAEALNVNCTSDLEGCNEKVCG